VTVETRSLEDPLVSNCESQERSAAPVPVPLLSPLNHDQHPRAQPHGVARHQPRIVRARSRVYDQPGKKPAAEYQPDPIKLQATCRRRGGADFACQWILIVFKDGVTLVALVRRLMDFPGGFEPRWASMAFWRSSTIALSAAFAQSVRGYGGRTRRMQCAICGSSTLG